MGTGTERRRKWGPWPLGVGFSYGVGVWVGSSPEHFETGDGANCFDFGNSYAPAIPCKGQVALLGHPEELVGIEVMILLLSES